MDQNRATCFYSGLSPWAPGTAGSIVAAIVGVLLLQYIEVNTLLLLTTLITIIGIKQINIYEKETKIHDDKSIVIDEVVGLWLAFVIASDNWTQIVLSFVFFRIFDIWKPSFIGRIDKNVKGGLGVMGDDLLAGLLAGICSSAVWKILEYLFNNLL
ncbi:MAG: phosphatidylglycerophosphatase A [Sulfurospirillum sp.]|nr:phosphatidylglycerophosphatase A [Sulfurospirillum sp.]